MKRKKKIRRRQCLQTETCFNGRLQTTRKSSWLQDKANTSTPFTLGEEYMLRARRFSKDLGRVGFRQMNSDRLAAIWAVQGVSVARRATLPAAPLLQKILFFCPSICIKLLWGLSFLHWQLPVATGHTLCS